MDVKCHDPMTNQDQPTRHGLLDVGSGQRIYWEEWGNPDGVPALYVHGGPGGTLGAGAYRHRFNLARTRVIGFEQRGCGRSVPHLAEPGTSLEGNDTPHLIGDMETLRDHLDVERWIVNGASWGSTLALAYAIEHPERVLGVVLFAVTTTSREEVEWITEGVGAVFPEAWDRFASYAEHADETYRRGQGRIVEAYARLMESPDRRLREEASREWALWEDTHLSIGTGGLYRDPRWDDESFRVAFFRLTAHYWSNNGFSDPPIADRLDQLADIPATLIHGRRDISSPAITAWRLHRDWPGSHLVIDEGDGHGGSTMLEHWFAANNSLVSIYDGEEGGA